MTSARLPWLHIGSTQWHRGTRPGNFRNKTEEVSSILLSLPLPLLNRFKYPRGASSPAFIWYKIGRDKYKFVISGSHDHKYCCLRTWRRHATRDCLCLPSRGQRPPAVSSLRHPRWCLLIISRWWDRHLRGQIGGGILWQFHTLWTKLTPGQYRSSLVLMLNCWLLIRHQRYQLKYWLCNLLTSYNCYTWATDITLMGELYSGNNGDKGCNECAVLMLMLWRNEAIRRNNGILFGSE